MASEFAMIFALIVEMASELFFMIEVFTLNMEVLIDMFVEI